MRTKPVPKVGIEPTFPKEHDFESCASAYSATSAKFVEDPALAGRTKYTTPNTRVKKILNAQT